jgi:hypothetical protein
MKTLATLFAASVLATAAYAQSTTVIQKEGVGSTTVVKEHPADTTVVKKKEVVTTGSTGCESKTVKKTDEFGDSKTKTKVEC